MTEEKVTPLTVKQLLSEGEYVIPIYQRNYELGRERGLAIAGGHHGLCQQP